MAPTPPESDGNSLLHIERISQYVSLSPASLNSPLPAICASIFSPLLLSYFPPARGIVLAYEDVQLSDTAPGKNASQTQDSGALLLRHVDEYTTPFLWATASLLVFRPQQHATLSGQITHQSRTHITLSHLNTFPVSVTSEHFPADWTWHAESANKMSKGWDGRISDDGGWWVNGAGEKVEGVLEGVRIRDFEGRMDGKGKGKGVMRIEGSLLSREEERERVAQKGGRAKGKQKAKTNGVLRRREEGGEVMEIE
jgi:DNA-directed RNA polymerase I subunit RPA43